MNGCVCATMINATNIVIESASFSNENVIESVCSREKGKTNAIKLSIYYMG